ncbi:MAG: hypothetical protein WCI41_01425 [bacterium]
MENVPGIAPSARNEETKKLAEEGMERARQPETLSSEAKQNIYVASDTKEKDEKTIMALTARIREIFKKKEVPQEQLQAAHNFLSGRATEKWREFYNSKNEAGKKEMCEKLIKGELIRSAFYDKKTNEIVIKEGVIAGGM